MQNHESEKVTISYAALLSLTEVGAGSLLHAFRIPFTGQFLSLNQIAIMSHAVGHHRDKELPLTFSTIAALLKSLSPIGKRVTPMLALTMQGGLFTCGLYIGGRSVIGRCLGALLSSLWSFLQPLLLYSFIFGKSIWDALFLINSKYLPEDLLLTLFAAVVGAKIIAALLLALFAPKIPLRYFEKISQSLQQSNSRPALQTSLKRSFKDLLRPSFLLAFGMVLFLLISSSYEADSMALMLLRPLAIGFLVSVAFRQLPVEKLLQWINKMKESSFQRALKGTLETVFKNH